MKKLWLVLLFMTFTMGAYSMIETLSLEQLVAESDAVIVATVQSVQKTGTSPEGFDDLEILANLVEASEVHKGQVSVGDKLEISTIANMEDSAEFVEGQKYFLFLNKADDKFQVCNEVQGCWPIDDNGQFSGMGCDVTLKMVKEAISNSAANP